jgi:hypothetical protein
MTAKRGVRGCTTRTEPDRSHPVVELVGQAHHRTWFGTVTSGSEQHQPVTLAHICSTRLRDCYRGRWLIKQLGYCCGGIGAASHEKIGSTAAPPAVASCSFTACRGLLRFGCSAPRLDADVRPNCLCVQGRHLGGSDTSNGMRHSSWPSRITSMV